MKSSRDNVSFLAVPVVFMVVTIFSLFTTVNSDKGIKDVPVNNTDACVNATGAGIGIGTFTNLTFKTSSRILQPCRKPNNCSFHLGIPYEGVLEFVPENNYTSLALTVTAIELNPTVNSLPKFGRVGFENYTREFKFNQSAKINFEILFGVKQYYNYNWTGDYKLHLTLSSKNETVICRHLPVTLGGAGASLVLLSISVLIAQQMFPFLSN